MNWLMRRTTTAGEINYSNCVTSGETNTTKFVSLPTINIVSTGSTARPYKPALTPIASPLRPHCLARDRLRLWIPGISRSRLDHTGSPVAVSDSDLDRILTVIAHSHAPSTRESYGSGLLAFHVFCDSRQVPEPQRCPASSILILAFIAACAGMYSGKTLENYLYSVRAWHLLHGQAWCVEQDQVSLALEGGKRLAPAASTRQKRAPFTESLIIRLRSALDLSLPLHAAVYACLTTSFFTLARTGEFTIPSLRSFDPLAHIRVCDMRNETDRNGFRVTVFHLPRTKVAPAGEDVYWATQSGATDPHAAMTNHLDINKPLAGDALFSWRHRAGLRPLTRTQFLQCLQTASDQSGGGALKGHGIRIGGTLEYLLRGVPFESVKTMGRWSSDAFLIYLR